MIFCRCLIVTIAARPVPIRVDNPQQTVYQILICRYKLPRLSIHSWLQFADIFEPKASNLSTTTAILHQGHRHTLFHFWGPQLFRLSTAAGENTKCVMGFLMTLFLNLLCQQGYDLASSCDHIWTMSGLLGVQYHVVR